MLARFLRNHLNAIKVVLFFLGCLPAGWLAQYWWTEDLGPNPLDTLTTVTGLSSLYFLWASLLITPLRRWMSQLAQWRRWQFGKRIADWNSLVRLRRQLGLWSFVYALLHVIVYCEFDSGWSLPVIADAVLEKPYLALGVIAALALIPLALTSPTAVMRRMGRSWLLLHRLVYVISLLVLGHYWLQAKSGTLPWLPEALVLALLLGYRVGLKSGWVVRWSGQNGLEAPDRSNLQQSAP